MTARACKSVLNCLQAFHLTRVDAVENGIVEKGIQSWVIFHPATGSDVQCSIFACSVNVIMLHLIFNISDV